MHTRLRATEEIEEYHTHCPQVDRFVICPWLNAAAARSAWYDEIDHQRAQKAERARGIAPGSKGEL